MFAISAVDAVSPAVQRTRTFLFRPFKWSTFLKLSLVALITEGLGSNFQSSEHAGPTSSHGPTVYSPFIPTPGLVALIVAVLVALIAVGCVVYYLVTRLRFAYFHCLIHNTKEILPGWRLYRTQATRFFWLNVAVGICFLLLAALVVLPFAARFWRVFRGTQAGGQPDIWLVLSLVLPLIPIALLLALLAVATDLILRDFMLPHYALETATAGEAWRAVWEQIRTEKGQFLAYALLRLVLPAIAMIAVFFVMILPALAIAGVVASLEIGIHSAFAGSTGAAAIIGIVLEVFFGALAFGFAVLVSICLGGPLSTGTREYALLFYGSRYQPLSEILFPTEIRPSPQGTS